MKRELARVLDTLEASFGRVRIPKRVSAFDMLVRLMCGYPASEVACEKGYAALADAVGTTADKILAAPKAALVRAMRAGGIVPEVRAARLQLIATASRSGADLRSRKVLRTLPTIGGPGADKILLFTRVEPVAAVPSNATQVPVRLGFGAQHVAYAATYRSIQAALDEALPTTYDARIRAHLLLKRHGQDVCKPARPRCDQCPLTDRCAYFIASRAAARS